MPSIAQRFALAEAASFSPPVARLMQAARLWVALARRHHNPRPVLRPLLAGGEPAFCHFMEALVAAWPEPFAAFPPCATCLSPDETAVARLLEAAARGQRETAEELFSDYLGPDERARLWMAASAIPIPLAEGA
jgi:hypothetical protein